MCQCACLVMHVWFFVTPWTIVPGSSVHGIFQAIILKWVAISSYQLRVRAPSLATTELAGRFFTTGPLEKLLCKFKKKSHFLTMLSSVQFSFSVVSKSLQPHRLQHTRLPCPSPTPGACWNSYPSSQWCHPAISSSVAPFSSCLQSFPIFQSFPIGSVLCIRWPKYWSFSFSISPSNEYSGLISFRIDWFDLFAVEGTLESSTSQFKSISSSVPSFLYSPTLTSIHGYWKNHSLD